MMHARQEKALRRLADDGDAYTGTEMARYITYILGDEHYHVASPVYNRACGVCGRDLMDEVHIRGAS